MALSDLLQTLNEASLQAAEAGNGAAALKHEIENGTLLAIDRMRIVAEVADNAIALCLGADPGQVLESTAAAVQQLRQAREDALLIAGQLQALVGEDGLLRQITALASKAQADINRSMRLLRGQRS